MSQLSQAKFSQHAGPSRAAVRAYLGDKAATKIQKFIRLRAKDRKVTGGFKRGTRGNSRAIKLYNSMGAGVVFPDRVEVNCCTTLCGYIATGRNTSAYGNYCSIYLNSLVGPFNTPTFSFTTTNATYSYAMYGTMVQGYAITSNPMMYGTMSSLYTSYRVVRYELEITVIPSNSADPVRICVLPIGGEEIPSTGQTSVNLRVLEEQPYVLSKTCSAGVIGGPGKNNTLVLSGAPYKDIGLSRDQYMAAGYQTSIGAIPAANIIDYAGLYIQPLNGSNNAAPVNVSMKLNQVVVLSDLINPVS